MDEESWTFEAQRLWAWGYQVRNRMNAHDWEHFFVFWIFAMRFRLLNLPFELLDSWNSLNSWTTSTPKGGSYDISYVLWIMSYVLCYVLQHVILRSYDLTALVYVLLLGLRLTIMRPVSMYCVLCRFYAFLRTCQFCHLDLSSSWQVLYSRILTALG
jgi:hypothetical protein